MKTRIITLFFFCIYLGQNLYAQGCSQCKLVAEQSSEMDESSFGSSINSGIIYLMFIPYLLLLFLFRKKILAVLRMVFVKN